MYVTALSSEYPIVVLTTIGSLDYSWYPDSRVYDYRGHSIIVLLESDGPDSRMDDYRGQQNYGWWYMYDISDSHLNEYR